MFTECRIAPAVCLHACIRSALTTASRHGVSLVGVALLFAVVGCAPVTGEGPGHRLQSLALSPAQELELGRKAETEVLHQVRLVDSGEQVDRVLRGKQANREGGLHRTAGPGN